MINADNVPLLFAQHTRKCIAENEMPRHQIVLLGHWRCNLRALLYVETLNIE